MTSTFPSISPDSVNTFGHEPKILRADFGDGYLQAAGDGINPYKDTWDLTFTNRPYADIQSIKTLLDTLNGAASFYWTPPGETPLTPNPKKWFQTGKYQYGKQGDGYSISFTVERTQTP